MRRLIAVLAAVAAVPLLTLSASAQGSGSLALVADLRAKCSGEISAGVAYSVQKGESRADAERELAEVLNEMVGPEGDEKTMQYVVDHASEIGENVPAANNFFRCVGGARLAQLRNGNRPVGQSAAAPAPRPTPPATSGPRVSGSTASTGAPGGGSTAVYDHNGKLVRSTGGSAAGESQAGSSSPASGGRMVIKGEAMGPTGSGAPSPDLNRCITFPEKGPTGQCKAGSPSLVIRAQNSCGQDGVAIQVCIHDTAANRWHCGSGTAPDGGTVMTYRCQTDGRYLWAACSQASVRASSGGSCGGDPNIEGY